MIDTRPLRIGIVAPYDLSMPGGVRTQIRAQARALRRLGHDVGVYGPASAQLPDGEAALAGSVSLKVGGTESGLGLNPLSARRVARLFRARPFDIVHVHEPLTPILPWLAVWFASAPVVATFHVHREQGHRLYAVSRPLLAPLARKLRARIAVSEPARRTVAEHFPGAYEIIPNGIELARFRTIVPRPPEMPPTRRWVLAVGRLEPRKGLRQLIRAIALVRRSVPHAGLVIVGNGPDRRALEQAARDDAAPVHFAGDVADEALPAYYQAADLICAPALGGESFGIVLLEAMACGKPIVASRINGYIGLAGDAECGLFVPPADAGALAAALVSLLEQDGLRQQLGARGAAVARQYDWSVLAERLCAIYDRVLPTVGSAG